jgi:hypothetical protein
VLNRRDCGLLVSASFHAILLVSIARGAPTRTRTKDVGDGNAGDLRCVLVTAGSDSFQQISALIDRFNPDEGDLPLLLKRYVNENLLQPFHAAQNPEPKLWALLSVAADHSRFLHFITGFLNGIPTSKTGTELLLLLDKLVQANLHAAQSLVGLDVVDGLKWTTSLSPKGAEMLLGLHAFHERALGKLRLWDESALAARYDHVRLDILGHLLRTTPAGYRADDARFLIGEIYWNQGRTANAVNTWRTISVDSGDECFSVCSKSSRPPRLQP